MRAPTKPSQWHLAGLFLLISLLAACSSSGPETFVRSFYATIEAGDTDQVVEMFAYKDMQDSELTAARGKVAMIVGMMQMKLKEAGGIEEVEIVKVTRVDDTHATVESVLHMGNGSSDSDKMELVRVDGQWKVSIF